MALWKWPDIILSDELNTRGKFGWHLMENMDRGVTDRKEIEL